MDVKLICQGGKNEGREIPVRGPEFVIGRGEGCHLRPGSREVSRRHAVILIRDGSVTVRDFGSKNGTFVNDQQIEGEHKLASGDLLRIGSLLFKVECSVDVGGHKRPKAKSVEEAAMRSASTPAAGDDEELDLGEWFEEGDEATSLDKTIPVPADSSPRSTADDTREVRQHRPDPPEKPAEGKKPPAPNFQSEKAADSKSAATDTLSKLLGRRS